MSRKRVIIDLVKTSPDGSNRELASRPCGTADRGTSIPRSANVRTLRPSCLNARPSSRTEPGSIVPWSTNQKRRDLRPHMTAPREQEGNASRPCGTTRATRTTHPSDQEGLIPCPAESLDQYHPSGQTR
ncbi:unnamed protein product [Microthlaspi erraticum]|uniref:Uncharacterized protein n=1 Tax=Microthlaspi erraticum TaxID=1685480 RepID=A0A6D2IUB0_9BRAS|nr:unnamed protein product [Microthlaspi erraticum]